MGKTFHGSFCYIRKGWYQQVKYYCEDAAAVLKDVDSSESGLSSEEAKIRLERDGRNELAAEKKDSLIKRFFF